QFTKLSLELDKRITEISRAVGEASLDAALVEALACWRKFMSFGHELSAITGQNKYEVRMTLKDKLVSDYHRRRLAGSRQGGALPAVSLGHELEKVLRDLRDAMPAAMPKVVEGEDLWQRHLAENNLRETDPNADYERG